jgi:hypothetical protein
MPKNSYIFFKVWFLLLQGCSIMYAPVCEVSTFKKGVMGSGKIVKLFFLVHKGNQDLFNAHHQALKSRAFGQMVRVQNVAKFYEDPLSFYHHVTGALFKDNGLRITPMPNELVCVDGVTIEPGYAGNEADGLAMLPGAGNLEFREGSPELLYPVAYRRIMEPLIERKSLHAQFHASTVSGYNQALALRQRIGNTPSDLNFLANNALFDSGTLGFIEAAGKEIDVACGGTH